MSVELLLFYYGASPRQLIAWRCCCRRWALLLREDRFWHRHHAALHQRWPRLSLALARAVPRRPELTLCAWYEAVSGAVRRYFESEKRVVQCPQLWEALLLAACGEHAQLTELKSVAGVTRLVRRPDCPFVTTVMLRWRAPNTVERQLRRAAGPGHKAKRTLPELMVWHHHRRMPDVEPQRLVYRLLTLLMGGAGSTEDKEPLL